jgi:hypothetical protein
MLLLFYTRKLEDFGSFLRIQLNTLKNPRIATISA